MLSVVDYAMIVFYFYLIANFRVWTSTAAAGIAHPFRVIFFRVYVVDIIS